MIDTKNPFYRMMLRNKIKRDILTDIEKLTFSSEMQAWASDDINELKNNVGRLVFIVLGAAKLDDVDPDDEDIVSVRLTADALADICEDVGVYRESIQAGVIAAKRIVPLLSNDSLCRAAMDLAEKLSNGDVGLHAFEDIFQA